MIQLLRYQMVLHLRMISSAVFVLLVLICVWISTISYTPEMLSVVFMNMTTPILMFFCLLLIFQLSNVHQVYFSPEAIQFRLARIRNRANLIVATLIQVTLVAIAASLPIAIVFISLFLDTGHGFVASGNLILFLVFNAHAAFLILRLTGGGSIGTLLVLALLFLVPMMISSTESYFQSTPIHGLVTLVADWSTSHLSLTSNPMMLHARGIQDTESIFRILFLTPILIIANYVLFLRKDHH